MFLWNLVLITVALLSAVVFGLPAPEDGIFNVNEINVLANGLRSPDNVNDRIFGGREAEIGQFPYQVSIQLKKQGNSFNHICGGSILTNRFIITAAQCLNRRSPAPTSYRIVVGAHTLAKNNGTAYSVQRWIVHERFYVNIKPNNATVQNDIALIQTEERIKFNPIQLISPLPLSHTFVYGGAYAVISGWGRSNVRLILVIFGTISL